MYYKCYISNYRNYYLINDSFSINIYKMTIKYVIIILLLFKGRCELCSINRFLYVVSKSVLTFFILFIKYNI